MFGTWSCTNVNIVTPNTVITCLTPPGIGFPDVKVYVNGVQSSFNQIFYYNGKSLQSTHTLDFLRRSGPCAKREAMIGRETRREIVAKERTSNPIFLFYPYSPPFLFFL